MKSFCSVLGCHSNSKTKGVEFYPFPIFKNKVQCQDWTLSTGRVGWKPRVNSRMCSLHFINYSKCKIPTLNLPKTTKILILDEMSFHESTKNYCSTATTGVTMKFSCSVLGCLSNSDTPGVLFYPFPTRFNKALRQDWIDSTGRMGWMPKATSRICSLHFKNHKKCKMPTLNLANTSEKIFLEKPVPVLDEKQAKVLLMETSSDGSMSQSSTNPVPMTDEKPADELPMETFTDGRMNQLKTNIARRILSDNRHLVDRKMLQYLKRVLTQSALCKRPPERSHDKKYQAEVEAALAAIDSTVGKHTSFERWYRKKLRYLAAPFVMCAGVERRALAAAPTWLRRAEAQLQRLPDTLREHFPIEECETMVECVVYATMGREKILAEKYGVAVEKILDVWNTVTSMLRLKLSLVSCAADDPLQLQMCAHLSAREWRAAALVLMRPKPRAPELVIYSWSCLGRPARELVRLVQQYGLEPAPACPRAPPERRARAASWYSAYKQYVQPGLACSMLVLQRRWYELKLDTRETFFAAHRTQKTSGIHPLHWIVAIRYPHVLTQPMPSWQRLVADGEVHHLTPEQMRHTWPVAPEPLFEDDYQMIPQCVHYMSLDKNPKMIRDDSLEANTEQNAVKAESNADEQNAAMDIEPDSVTDKEISLKTELKCKVDTEENAVLGAPNTVPNVKMDIESEIITKEQNAETLPSPILSPPLPDMITDLKTTIETNEQLDSEQNPVDDVKTVENELKTTHFINKIEDKIKDLFTDVNEPNASDSLTALESIDPSEVETTVVFENDSSDSDDMQLYVDEDTADNFDEVNSDDDFDNNPNSHKHALINIKKEIDEDMPLNVEPFAGEVKSENATEDRPTSKIPCLVNSIINEYNLNKSKGTVLPDQSRNIPNVVDDKSHILETNQNLNSLISCELSSVVKSEPDDETVKSKSRIMFEDDIDIDILNTINKMETSENESDSDGNSEPSGDIDEKLTMDAVVKLVKLEHSPLWANVHNNTYKPVYKTSIKEKDTYAKEDLLVEKDVQPNLDDKSSCEYPRRPVVLPDLEQVRRQLSYTPAARVAPVSVTGPVQGTSETPGMGIRGSKRKGDGPANNLMVVQVVRQDTGDVERRLMHRKDFVVKNKEGDDNTFDTADLPGDSSRTTFKETGINIKYAAKETPETEKDLELNATLTREQVAAIFELEKMPKPPGSITRGSRTYCCLAAWSRQHNDARRRAAERRRQPITDHDWHRTRHHSSCDCCCAQQTRGLPPDMAAVQALRTAARATLKHIIRQAKHTAQKLAEQTLPEPPKTTDTAKSSSEDELTICEIKKRQLKKPENENKTDEVPKKKKKKKKKRTYVYEEPKQREALNDYDEWIRQKNDFKRFFTIGNIKKETKNNSDEKIKEDKDKKDTGIINEMDTVNKEDTCTLPIITVTNNPSLNITVTNNTLSNNILPSSNTLPDNTPANDIIPINTEPNNLIMNKPIVSNALTLPFNTVTNNTFATNTITLPLNTETNNILATNTMPGDVLPKDIVTDNTSLSSTVVNSTATNDNVPNNAGTDNNILQEASKPNNLQSSAVTENQLGNNALPTRSLINLLTSPSAPPNISQDNPLLNVRNIIISTLNNQAPRPPQVIGKFLVSTGKGNELVIQPMTMSTPVPKIDLTQDDEDSSSVEEVNTIPAEAKKLPDLVAINSLKIPDIKNLTQSKCLASKNAQSSASNISEKNQEAPLNQNQHKSQIQIDSLQGKVVFKIVNPHPPTLKILNQIIKEKNVKTAKGISVKTPTAINASLDEKSNYLLNVNSEMPSANKESLKSSLNDSSSFLDSMLQESTALNDIDIATPSTSTNNFAPLTEKNVALHDMTSNEEFKSNDDLHNTEEIEIIEEKNVSDVPVISNVISLNDNVQANLKGKEKSRSMATRKPKRLLRPWAVSDSPDVKSMSPAHRSIWRLNTAAKVYVSQFLRQPPALYLLRVPSAAPLVVLPAGRIVLTERLLRCEQASHFGLVDNQIYRLFGFTPTIFRPVTGGLQLVSGDEGRIMGDDEGGQKMLAKSLAAELSFVTRELDDLDTFVGKVVNGVTSIALAQMILSEGNSLLLYQPGTGHMTSAAARGRVLPDAPGVRELVNELNKLNSIVRSGQDWAIAPT